jgi:chorismate mutase
MSKTIGIRGAITVSKNSNGDIVSSTRELLREIVRVNKVRTDDIVSIVFTATKDLNAEFPASAARSLGLKATPLLCAREIDVPGSLRKCIRILMLVNSGKPQSSVKHVYLKGAKVLREDLN